MTNENQEPGLSSTDTEFDSDSKMMKMASDRSDVDKIQTAQPKTKSPKVFYANME